MFKTIYDITTGEIITCQKFNDMTLAEKLRENANWDYIVAYTKGVKNIAVDVQTKKLKKVDPPSESPEDIKKFIRANRSRLLQQSDWTQAADSPLSDAKKAAWATYRQALRDLPDEQGSVNSSADVVWPTPPV